MPPTEPDSSAFKGKSLDQLLGALHDASAWNRVRAAYWLSQANAPAQVVPALAKALQDEEAFVRWAAAFSLSLIGAASEPALPALIEALKDIYDPEIPADIYELGLIYKVDIDDDRMVNIDMTLTTPNCPSAAELPMQVETAVAGVPGVREAKVNIVWDPPWDPSRMSDEARLVLNMW